MLGNVVVWENQTSDVGNGRVWVSASSRHWSVCMCVSLFGRGQPCNAAIHTFSELSRAETRSGWYNIKINTKSQRRICLISWSGGNVANSIFLTKQHTPRILSILFLYYSSAGARLSSLLLLLMLIRTVWLYIRAVTVYSVSVTNIFREKPRLNVTR